MQYQINKKEEGNKERRKKDVAFAPDYESVQYENVFFSRSRKQKIVLTFFFFFLQVEFCMFSIYNGPSESLD